ncbi:MAG: cation:proton antiporter, partial [Helicobacter sp.]|nr:cation:proton antiporter [Helicobacter sp.]
MGEEALQHFMSLGLVSILLMLSPLLSYFVKLPPSIAEILLGLCVASFGWLNPNDSVFFVLAKMGFFFLMFLAGMEIDLRYFRKLGISFAKRA